MADATALIERYQKMATDDPSNELAHFSLGRAQLDAGQRDQAIASFQRVLELNPNITKAYQLMASALLDGGQRDRAIERLTEGVRKADERGDVMPRNEMTKMLQDLGAPVPELKQKAGPAQPVGEGQVLCQRCNRVASKLPSPPFSNAMGKMIQEKVCTDCWREWIGMGTKVINELRLPLSDPKAQKIFDEQMLEFLNLK